MNIRLCDICGLRLYGDRYRPFVDDLDLCLDHASDFNVFVREKVQELRKKSGYKPPLVTQTEHGKIKIEYEPVKLLSPTPQGKE